MRSFIERFWRSVETSEFTAGWHIDAICDHLTAVSEGKIKRLIINIPPRHMKSLGVSVFWPAWDWYAHNPGRRFLYASYAESLSIRDSVKCRRIVDNDTYLRWMRSKEDGKGYTAQLQSKYRKWRLTSDQNTKIRFDNSAGGYRLATSVGGALTGEGGDFIVVDDPHNVMESESTVIREGVIQWWDEAMSTRLNNPSKGAYVVIMQRVHEKDLTGHILAKNQGWDHLCLPARYEGKNRVISTLHFTDPRTEENEPLWPARMPEQQLSELEASLGAYAAAGQLQQNPAPRKGGMFEIDKFQMINVLPTNHVIESVRYWDKAATAGGGCLTAGVLMHKLRTGRYVVSHVNFGHWSWGQREQIIKKQADEDGPDVSVWTEQEPGSGGKESAERTIMNLAGHKVFAHKVSGEGDKVRRAQPWSSAVLGGLVDLVVGAWNDEFKVEHGMFPNGKMKDMVDASSGAFIQLTVKKQRAGVWGKPLVAA